MKRGSTLFLKAVVVLMGLAVLAVCVFALPVAIKSGEAGGYTPILLGLYLPTIPFFIALYMALKLLGYIDENRAFSDLSVNVLKNIKYCGVAISAMFVLGLPYIFITAERDDAPGVIVLALVIIFASIAVATFAAVLQKLLRDALAIKSENDLTV